MCFNLISAGDEDWHAVRAARSFAARITTAIRMLALASRRPERDRFFGIVAAMLISYSCWVALTALVVLGWMRFVVVSSKRPKRKRPNTSTSR